MSDIFSVFKDSVSSVSQKPLFDKRINITFSSVVTKESISSFSSSSSSGNSVFGGVSSVVKETFDVLREERIMCPTFGPKPQISLNGNFVLSPVVTELQLRVTNLRLSRPLSDYKTVYIEAGYGNSLKQTLSGVIQYAYQETPGPDGITAFLFFPTFYYNEWINKPFVKPAYPANTLVSTIFGDICAELGAKLNYVADLTLNVGPAGFDRSGAIKDVAVDLATNFGLMFRLEGDSLIVFQKNGTSIVHGLNILSSPPRKDAAGWSVVAPWDPAIRPGDELWFDPAFAKSSFGGFIMSKTPQFIVISIELEFSTVSPENMMRIVMVEKEFFDSNQEMTS